MLEEAMPHQYVSLTFLVYVYMVMQLLGCFRCCYYAGNEGAPWPYYTASEVQVAEELKYLSLSTLCSVQHRAEKCPDAL